VLSEQLRAQLGGNLEDGLHGGRTDDGRAVGCEAREKKKKRGGGSGAAVVDQMLRAADRAEVLE
jgi:hypothetical protein